MQEIPVERGPISAETSFGRDLVVGILGVAATALQERLAVLGGVPGPFVPAEPARPRLAHEATLRPG